MKRDDLAFDRKLEDMLERGRTIRPLADVVRARALARARTTIAARESSPVGVVTPAAGRRGMRIAVAASLTLIAGATGAVAAIRGNVLERFRPSPPASARAIASEQVHAARAEPAPSAAPEPQATVKARVARQPTAPESYAAELRLLHRAQLAYASEDFSAALMLAAEHARQFPHGRLAEEREALRVRSLAGSGRTEDARRATAAFAARFPRSVLLPRLQQTVGP